MHEFAEHLNGMRSWSGMHELLISCLAGLISVSRGNFPVLKIIFPYLSDFFPLRRIFSLFVKEIRKSTRNGCFLLHNIVFRTLRSLFEIVADAFADSA